MYSELPENVGKVYPKMDQIAVTEVVDNDHG
jgi:hypothetical protein